MSTQVVGTIAVLLLVSLPSAAYLIGHWRGERHATVLMSAPVRELAIATGRQVAAQLDARRWDDAPTVRLPQLDTYQGRHAVSPWPHNSAGHWYRQQRSSRIV